MSKTPLIKPYVGLIPFHEEDAEFFFGREQEREVITSNPENLRGDFRHGTCGLELQRRWDSQRGRRSRRG